MYQLRPALDKPVQSHDMLGKDLVLFLPVEAEEKRVKDYIFKHCSEGGLDATHTLLFPTLEAAALAVFFATKAAKMNVRSLQIPFSEFQDPCLS